MADSGNDHASNCLTRSLMRALSAVEVEKSLRAATERGLMPALASVGIRQSKDIGAMARLLRSRVASMNSEQLHYWAGLLSEPAGEDLAGYLDEARGATEIPDDKDERSEFIATLCQGGPLERVAREWSIGIAALVIDGLWEDGFLRLDHREALSTVLEGLADVPFTASRPPRRSQNRKPIVSAFQNVDGCREDHEAEEARRASIAASEGASDGDRHPRSHRTPSLSNFNFNVENSLDDLIAAAVAAARVATTRASPVVRSSVEWLVSLDPARSASWYPYGLLVGAEGEDSASRLLPPTPECRREFLLGRVGAAALRGDSRALASIAEANVAGLDEALAAGARPQYLAELLASVVVVPLLFARLVAALDSPIERWPAVVAAAQSHVDEALAHGGDAVVGAEILLNAIESALERWSRVPEGFGAGFEQAATEIRIQRASCKRRRRDFVGCLRLLAQVDHVALDAVASTYVAQLAEEKALASVGVDDISSLTFPNSVAEWRSLCERLGGVTTLLREAAEANPGSLGPRLLLAILDFAGGNDGAAAQALNDVATALDDAEETAALRRAVRFFGALARLRCLEPGTDETWLDELVGAVESGFSPSDDAIATTAEALAAHGSARLATWLAQFSDTVRRNDVLRKLLAETARAGDADAIALIERWGTDPRSHPLPVGVRFDLVDAALEGATHLMDVSNAERLAGLLDDIVHRGQDPQFEQRWAVVLETNEMVRQALGPPNADALRVHVLRRLGRLEEARAVGEMLFYRAVSGTVPELDPHDVLAVLRDLRAPADRIARLADAVGPDDAVASDGADDRVVRVLFVGGNEMQENVHRSIEARLSQRHDDRLAVEWFFPGWGSNWGPIAEQIEARYGDADVVVLMAFVRTMFGQRIRRTAGAAGLPWVACTGHGRESMMWAIERAATVVRTLEDGGAR